MIIDVLLYCGEKLVAIHHWLWIAKAAGIVLIVSVHLIANTAR